MGKYNKELCSFCAKKLDRKHIDCYDNIHKNCFLYVVDMMRFRKNTPRHFIEDDLDLFLVKYKNMPDHLKWLADLVPKVDRLYDYVREEDG